MAIDWLDDAGDVKVDDQAPEDKTQQVATEADENGNPINANYFEDAATHVTEDVAIEVSPAPPVPALEEAILAFEQLNLSRESLDQIIDLAYHLDTTGLVSRSVAMEARDLLIGFDNGVSLKAYTAHPSKTRYQQAMESMSGGMIAMLAAAAVAITTIVYKVLKMVFGRSDPITAAKIDKLADKKEPTAEDVKAVINVTPTPAETVKAHEETATLTTKLSNEVTQVVFDGIPGLLDKAFRANEISYVGFENGRTDRVHQIRNVREYNDVLFAYLRDVEPMILQQHEWPFRSVAFTVALDGDIHDLVRTMDAIAAEVERRRVVTVGWASEIGFFLANYNTRTTPEKLQQFKQMNVKYSELLNAPVMIPKVNAASGGSIRSLASSIKAYFESVVQGKRKPSLHNVSDMMRFYLDNPLANGSAPKALMGVIKNRQHMLSELAEVSGAIDLINTRLGQVSHASEGGPFDPQLARDISGAIDDIRGAQQGVTLAIAAMEHEVSLYEHDFATMVRILSETVLFVSDLHIGYAKDVTADSATNVKALLALVADLQALGSKIAKEVDAQNSRARESCLKLLKFAERTVRTQLPRPK